MGNDNITADILLGYAKSFGIKNSGVPLMGTVDAENAVKAFAAFTDAAKGVPAEAEKDGFDLDDLDAGEGEAPGDSPADPDEDGGRAPKDFEKDNTPKDDADEDKDAEGGDTPAPEIPANQSIDMSFEHWPSRQGFIHDFNQLLAVVRQQAEQINTLQTRINALEANLDQTDEAVQGIKARTTLIGTY